MTTPATAVAVLSFEDVRVGQELPSVVLPVTLSRCVMDAAATRDFFPGHHDRDYARSQNARDAYLNTMFFHGFVDRVVTDWAGPTACVRRRTLRMIAPVCSGDTMEARATVIRCDAAAAVVEVEIRIHTEQGLRATAVVSVVVPSAGRTA
jgi:acyl dehydratase